MNPKVQQQPSIPRLRHPLLQGGRNLKLQERIPLSAFLIFLFLSKPISAQQSISLQKAQEAAIEYNHMVNIREYQVREKESKVAESKIKALPSVIAGSTWQYNQNLGELVIGAGSLGTLPLSQQYTIPLPLEDLRFSLSRHRNFNAGVTLYQPLSQLAKIKAGVNVAKTELQIAGREKDKTIQQICLAVEKLYYALLISQKLHEEAVAKTELAKIRLGDVESALKAGKTTDVNRSGLLANLADEEQNLLKVEIQAGDFQADFSTLTGLTDEKIILEAIEFDTTMTSVERSILTGGNMNYDLKIARLGEKKAAQGITAARWGYLPDFGFIAGYNYQKGNKIYPEKNPYIGANLKWNLQDIFLNHELVRQRQSQWEQAGELVMQTENQLKNDIGKSERKLTQAKALIHVAQRAVKYRKEELIIQRERFANGLNTRSDVLGAEALLAKAEADLLSSQLNYRIIYSELQTLFSN